jgi:hypothetical protein
LRAILIEKVGMRKITPKKTYRRKKLLTFLIEFGIITACFLEQRDAQFEKFQLYTDSPGREVNAR